MATKTDIKSFWFYPPTRWSAVDAMFRQLLTAAGLMGEYRRVDQFFFSGPARWAAVDDMLLALFAHPTAPNDGYRSIRAPQIPASTRWPMFDTMMDTLYTAFEPDGDVPPRWVSLPRIGGRPVVGFAPQLVDGVVEDGTITNRALLLAGTAVALNYVPQPADEGSYLQYRNTAASPGGKVTTRTSAKDYIERATGTPTPSPTPVPTIILTTLSLSGALQIGVATSGTIIGATAGSIITGNIPGITINTLNRTYSGTPTGTEATITDGLRETLLGASNSGRLSTIVVAAAAVVAPTLNALSLSSTSGIVGTAKTITILGATGGSVISGTVPDGMTLNSGARTITGTPTQDGTFSFNLIETLAGATNSGRSSTVSVVIDAASVPGQVASSTFTGKSFAPFNTTSIVQSFEWDHNTNNGNTFVVMLLRTDNAQLYPPAGNAIQLRIGVTSFTLGKYTDGVAGTTNIGSVTYSPVVANGDHLIAKINADRTLTITRVSDSAVIATVNTENMDLYFSAQFASAGKYVSMHGDVSGTALNVGLTNMRAKGYVPIATIADVPVGASSDVRSGKVFDAYPTGSAAQSFDFNWNSGGTFRVFFNRTDTSTAYPPTDGICALIRPASLSIGTWVNGAETTRISNRAYLAAPPAGTACNISRNADGSIVLVRKDTGADVVRIPASETASFVLPYTGQYLSMYGNGGASTYLDSPLANMKAGPIAVPVTVNSIILDSAYRPTIDINYTGVGITGYNVQLMNGTADVGPKQPATVTVAGAAHLVLTPSTTFTAAQFAANVKARIYPVINGTESQQYQDTPLVTMPAGPLAPPIAGLNRAAYSSSYFNELILSRDRGMQAAVRTPALANYIPPSSLSPTASNNVNSGPIIASDSGMTQDGSFTTIVGGSSFLVQMPWRWDTGTYQLGNKDAAWPSGLTVSMNNSAGASFDGTTKQLTITQESPAVGITFTVGGTMPAGGFRLSCKKVGDPTPNLKYADIAKTTMAWLGAKVVRYMDQQNTNGEFAIRNSISDFYTGPTGMGPVSFDTIIDESNGFGTDPWVCIGWNWSVAAIKAVVAKFYGAGGLAAGRRAYFELSNEVWNNAFWIAAWAAMEGVAKGYRSNGVNALAPLQVAAITGLTDESGNIDGFTGIPSVSYAQGKYVYIKSLNGVGMLVLQANRAITANSSADAVAGTTNAAWTVIANNFDCNEAKKFVFSDRAKQTIVAINEQMDEMGIARDRAVRVVAWSTGSGISSYQQILSWGGLGALHDAFATAPYFGGGQAGYDLGSYSDNRTGWGAAQKNLVATDVPAFKAAYLAIATEAIDAIIDQSAASKAAMDIWMQATFARRPRWICYEAGHHWVQRGSWPAAITTTFFPLIYKSAEHGALYEYYINRWNTKCGDLMCMYDQGGIKVANDNNNWTIMDHDKDYTRPNALALHNVNGGSNVTG